MVIFLAVKAGPLCAPDRSALLRASSWVYAPAPLPYPTPLLCFANENAYICAWSRVEATVLKLKELHL